MKTPESLCLWQTFPQTDSILGSRLHICIIPVWHGFKAQSLGKRHAPSPSVRRGMRSGDGAGGRLVLKWISSGWSAAAAWSCILSQTHYCCLLTCVAELPVFTAVSYDAIRRVSRQSSRRRNEPHVSAKTTCSSIRLHESHQEGPAAGFDRADLKTFGVSNILNNLKQIQDRTWSFQSHLRQVHLTSQVL